MSDSGKYSGFGYPDIRVPVEITNIKHNKAEKFTYVSCKVIRDMQALLDLILHNSFKKK